MCANREPATGYERVPGTPGCSCDGLRDALAACDRYRAMALKLACDAFDNYKRDGGYGCWHNCEHRGNGGYCAAVLEEVDGE